MTVDAEYYRSLHLYDHTNPCAPMVCWVRQDTTDTAAGLLHCTTCGGLDGAPTPRDIYPWDPEPFGHPATGVILGPTPANPYIPGPQALGYNNTRAA